MVSLSFMGFFHLEVLLSRKLTSVTITAEYLRITLEKAKNDQERKGNEIFIARLENKYCPVKLVEEFWSQVGLSGKIDKEAFLISRLHKTKYGHAASKSKGISQTTAREDFNWLTEPMKESGRSFTPHSLRAGGASMAIQNGISERPVSKHERWRSERARNGYILDSKESRLCVTRALGL